MFDIKVKMVNIFSSSFNVTPDPEKYNVIMWYVVECCCVTAPPLVFQHGIKVS